MELTTTRMLERAMRAAGAADGRAIAVARAVLETSAIDAAHDDDELGLGADEIDDGRPDIRPGDAVHTQPSATRGAAAPTRRSTS